PARRCSTRARSRAARRGSRAAPPPWSACGSQSRSRLPPGAARAEQALLRIGAPGAGCVRFRPGALLLPPGDDRVDDAPRLLDLVAAREQRAVADHRIEQQALVGVGALAAER